MHTIIIVGDTAYGAQCRAALEGTEGLDEIEQLLLVEEKTDAIGCLGGIARSTQQKALQLDGMSLLIKGIGAIPCLAVNLGRESTIGIKGEVGIGTAESKLLVITFQLILNLAGSNLTASLCQEILRSKGAPWLAVLPDMAEICLLNTFFIFTFYLFV